jgi:hypothetical protein
MKTRKQEIREIQEMYGIRKPREKCWFFENVVLPIIGLLFFFLLVFLAYGCQPRMTPGYAKYQEYKHDRIECPGEQLKANREKKLKWYNFWH